MATTTDKFKPRSIGRPRPVSSRRRKDRLFVAFCIASAALAIFVLAALLLSIAAQGIYDFRAHRFILNWNFVTGVPSREASEAGLWPALIGTLWLLGVCAATAIPIGVGTAVLLEEFKPRSRAMRRLQQFVQLNITNLAGVPSLVYGLLGLTAFAFMFGAIGESEATRRWPGTRTVEFGNRYFVQYVAAGQGDLRSGQVSYYARVPSRDASLPKPGEVTQFYDGELNPIDVQVLDAAATAARQAEIEQLTTQTTALGRDVFAAMTANPKVEKGEIERIVAAGWQKLGLRSDVTKVQDVAATELRESLAEFAGVRKVTDRPVRKAIEAAVAPIVAAEAAVRFGPAVSVDAAGQPALRPRFWYFGLPLGRSVLAGGLTLMLVTLPVIIISSQEALRAVPNSLRQASFGLGATRWQTIRNVTLPSAVPGIMTGVILAMSRAIGEAAPILILAGIVFIRFTPTNVMDEFTAMPLQIFNWASRPQREFYDLAAAGIILLLGVLLSFNLVAILIRQRAQKQG